MRFLYISIILLIIITFYSFSFGFETRSKLDLLSDRLIKEIGQKLGQKLNMSLMGIGGGIKDGKLRQISVTFRKYGEPLNIEQSRKIMIDCVQAYLNEINANREIQPYLINRPFTAKNLDISILSFYSNGSITLDPYIGDITEINGNLYYCTRSALIAPYKSEFKETYEEALAKVKQKPIIQEEQNFTIFPANS